MNADYKSRANHQQKKSLPGYVWLLSGLAIGLFVAFIVYLDKQPENPKDFGTAVQQELEKLKQQARTDNTAGNDAASKARSKPSGKTADDTEPARKEQKFNFYTLLPELEVLIPESETRPPENNGRVKHNDEHSALNKMYVLQVGSFQNKGDAEKLKANLAFLGLQASIQNVTVNNQHWHRVRTGPYNSREQLYKSQDLLKQNDINAISMELK